MLLLTLMQMKGFTQTSQPTFSWLAGLVRRR